MEFEQFKKGFRTLPLGLMRVKIDDNGILYDSQNGVQEHHQDLYAYAHEKYKSFVDEIREAGGYVLVKIDSNGNPISIAATDVPIELADKIRRQVS